MGLKSIINTTGSRLSGLFASDKNEATHSKKRYSNSLVKKPQDRIKMDMAKLVNAVDMALDPINNDRLDLLTMYENTWKDSQVVSEREKADAYLVTERFDVVSGKTVSPEKTKLFQRPWFFEYMKDVMHAEFWGHTLLEFQDQDSTGEFTDVIVFPRKYVRPWEGVIVTDPVLRNGVPYKGIETDLFLLPIGRPEELGKLETCTREVIWKNFARSDWSEANERFGKAFLDFAVNTADEAELRAKVEMAENFGSSGYVIRDLGDEITMVPPSAKDSGESFEKMAMFCDEQIAKLFNGQTGTSQEKSFVGSAEVHERVLDRFNESRLMKIQNNVNYVLIPFLIFHGYKLSPDDRLVFRVLNEDEKKEKEALQQKQSDQPVQPKQPDGEDANKNKEPENSTIGFFA